MKRHLLKFATVAALAGGMAFAQAPATAPAPSTYQPQAAGRAGKLRAAIRHRLVQALNLSAAQKQQAKAVFQQAKQDAQPIAQQLKQNREALTAAVKANDVSQIQTLSAQQGNLRGQVLAIRSEAMAKFYSSLTPEQRAKADQIQQKIMQRLMQLRKANNG